MEFTFPASIRVNTLIKSSSWARSTLSTVSKLITSSSGAHSWSYSRLRSRGLHRWKWVIASLGSFSVVWSPLWIWYWLQLCWMKLRWRNRYFGGQDFILVFWVIDIWWLLLWGIVNLWDVVLLIVKFWSLSESCVQWSSNTFRYLIFLLISFTYIVHLIVGRWREIWLGLCLRTSLRSFLNCDLDLISNIWLLLERLLSRLRLLQRLSPASTSLISLFLLLPFFKLSFELILLGRFLTWFCVLIFHAILSFHILRLRSLFLHNWPTEINSTLFKNSILPLSNLSFAWHILSDLNIIVDDHWALSYVSHLNWTLFNAHSRR